MLKSELIKFNGMLRRAPMGFTLWFWLWFGFGFGFWPGALLVGLPAGFPPPFGLPPNVPNKFIFGFGAAIHRCAWNEEKGIYLFHMQLFVNWKELFGLSPSHTHCLVLQDTYSNKATVQKTLILTESSLFTLKTYHKNDQQSTGYNFRR